MPDEPVALAHIKLAWHCAVLASICADVTPISATAMLVLRSMLGERRGRWQRASAEALVKKRCGGPQNPLALLCSPSVRLFSLVLTPSSRGNPSA